MKYYGVSQDGLAEMLSNLTNREYSQQMISKYTKGSNPDIDTIIALSYNFNISIDTLLVGDLSEFAEQRYSKSVRYIIDILPPILTNNPDESEKFEKAIRNHKFIVSYEEKYKLDKNELNSKVEEALCTCVENYSEIVQCHEVNDTIISAASNLMWILVYAGIAYAMTLTFGKIHGESTFSLPSLDFSMEKRLFLKGNIRRDADYDYQNAEEYKAFKKDTHDIINRCLRILKNSKSKDRVNRMLYYTALLFYYDLYDNDNSTIENRTIGAGLIELLIDLGNPYAKKSCEILKKD